MSLEKLKQRTQILPTILYAKEKTLECKVWTLVLNGEFDNLELKEKILNYKKQFPESNSSNILTWNSNYYTHHDTDIFDEFISKINKKINTIINGSSTFKVEYKIDEFWTAIYEKSTSTANHNHGEFPLCFCYYVEADENTSPIVFESSHVIQPKPSMLIIFPGLLNHYVPVLKYDSKRTIFSGNLVRLPRKKLKDKK